MFIKNYNCPQCGGSTFHRLKRPWWMHFIPESRYISCKTCDHSFMSTMLENKPSRAELIISGRIFLITIILFVVFLLSFFLEPFLPGKFYPWLRKWHMLMKYSHIFIGLVLFLIGLVWMAMRAFKTSRAWAITFVLTLTLAQFPYLMVHKKLTSFPVKLELYGLIYFCVGMGYSSVWTVFG